MLLSAGLSLWVGRVRPAAPLWVCSLAHLLAHGDGPQAPHLEGTPRFTGWMGASGNQRVHKASGGERVSALAPTRPSPARGLTLAQEKTVGNGSLRYCGDRFLFPCMSLSW